MVFLFLVTYYMTNSWRRRTELSGTYSVHVIISPLAPSMTAH